MNSGPLGTRSKLATTRIMTDKVCRPTLTLNDEEPQNADPASTTKKLS